MSINYPPSHRDNEDPQPELCDLCGVEIGGAHLMISNVEGLRGWNVCDLDSCVEFRSNMSYQDRLTFNAREHSVIGSSRIFLPGAAKRFDID